MNGFTIAGIVVIAVGLILWFIGILMEETEWEDLVPFSWLVIFCGLAIGGFGIHQNDSHNEHRKNVKVKQALVAALPQLKDVVVSDSGSEVSFRVGSGPSAVECETGVEMVHGKVVIQEQTDYRAPLPQVCQRALLPIPGK